MRRRGGRKRALGTRKPIVSPDGPIRQRSLDFVSDALTDRRRFHILAGVDDFSREYLVLVADTSLSGQRVARELSKVIVERDMPQTTVQETDTDWHYIAPGNSQQNGFTEELRNLG